MKMQARMFWTVVFVSGIAFNAISQIDLLRSTTTGTTDIIFRSHDNARRETCHYGDLSLNGGVGSTTWGWLSANRANISGYTSVGELYSTSKVTIAGNLSVLGSKSFIHPHPTDTTKVIRYIALESSEALTITRGTAKTVNGQAVIALPEHFSLVTNKECVSSVCAM